MALVEYEVKDKIAYITLNRPEKVNAVNKQMLLDLADLCNRFNEDRNAWVVIISGKGRGFCAGADLAGEDPEFLSKADNFYLDIQGLKKPSIVAVHGYCLAQGMGIFLCSDIRIAAEGTKFGWPQVKRGISSVSGPGFAVHYLPRNIGYQYLFTGDFFSVEEASKLSIVNIVVPEGKLMSVAEDMARRITVNAPLAVQGMKEAAQLGMEVDLKHRLRISAMILARIQQTKDAQEGLRAFEEKRQPVWKGK